MTRRRLATAGTVAAIAATVLLFGGVSREGGAAQPTPVAAAQLTGDFAVRGAAASLVVSLEEQVRGRPRDAHALTSLGLAYQQRARETADAAYLARSEEALRRALALRPTDPITTGALAALALSRHEFRQALLLARRARALAPGSARPFGLLGDALVELGRYREAFVAFDRMAGLKPGLAAYARIAYARELLGNTRGAEAAFRLALDAASGQPEPLAWTHVQLGKLFWSVGRIGAAAREYRAALAVFPGYVYAYDSLAQVEAARGHLPHAIALERRAADAVPLPQFVGALGDLYRVAGDEPAARKQYALIGVIERLLRANGVRTDLETAFFDVDHGIRLPEALALARASYADRPSIDGDDILAWALARNGRCAEALHYSRRALRLGTLDATKFFHRGMIERCLGDAAEARRWFRRARDLNPHFSLLWAPVAQRYAS
jgi:tetratricopeptide (TPR) repeat protein